MITKFTIIASDALNKPATDGNAVFDVAFFDGTAVVGYSIKHMAADKYVVTLPSVVIQVAGVYQTEVTLLSADVKNTPTTLTIDQWQLLRRIH